MAWKLERVSIGLAVLLACAGISCDELSESDLDPAGVSDWLPLVEGARWRYADEYVEVGAEPRDPYVVELEVMGTERRNGLDYVRIGEPDGTPDLYRLGPDSVLYEWPRDLPFEIPMLDISYDPRASMPVEVEYVEGTDTMWATGTLTDLGTEDVTLSFGVVPDCRAVELRGTLAFSSSAEPDLAFVTTAWFAQGIGFVKRVHQVYEGDALTETETTTLLYYEIPGGETGGDSGLYPLTGRVLEWGGEGVTGVTVQLWTGEANAPTAVTGAGGTYAFADIRSGPYMVSVPEAPEGYVGATTSVDVSVVAGAAEAPDLVLVRTQDPQGFEVRGTLLNPAGLPIPGASVRMARGPATLEWTADVNGDWWAYSVPAGTYVLSADLDYFTFEPDSLLVTLNDSTEGGAVSDMDFTGTGGATVTGRIVTPLEIALEGVVVGFGNPFGTPQVFDTTDADGVYAFPDIAPGSYWVWGADARYSYSYGANGVEVEVVDTAGAVEDIVAEPAGGAPYVLSGTIRNSRGMGPLGDDNATIRFYSPLFGTDVSSAISTGDGVFTTQVHDGPYVISVDLTRYPDPTPDSVVVNVNGAGVAGIAFVFTGYTATGRVTDAGGTGISGASVGIDGNGMAQVVTVTAGDGSFSFTDLLLGTYTVGVWKDGYTFNPTMRDVSVSGNTTISTFIGTPVPPDSTAPDLVGPGG